MRRIYVFKYCEDRGQTYVRFPGADDVARGNDPKRIPTDHAVGTVVKRVYQPLNAESVSDIKVIPN